MSSEEPTASQNLPLAGIRVLSQAIVWAGPAASLILADLGAEVIEIESIQHVNPTRSNYRFLPELYMKGPFGALYANRDPSEGFWNRNAHFNFSKRNHKSVTLDIDRPDGIELLLDLVRISDVYIENNAANVVEKYGLDYPDLAELNPRIVMARFPGFGTTGPYRSFKGFAPTMDALGGHTALRGYRDSDPSWTPGLAHGDPNAGIHVAFAVQAALFARERTGRGQMIDLSHVEAGLHHISWALMDYSFNGRVQETMGNRHPSKAPNGIFRCTGERRWIAIAVDSDEQFIALAEVMGSPELANDPRFSELHTRYDHQDELEALIENWTSQHEARALMFQLQAAKIPATELLWQEELRDDPHLQQRGFWQEVAHPEAGTHSYPTPVARFRQQPLRIRTRAPLLGEHNEEILQGLLGVSKQHYQQLIDNEIIGTAYKEDAS
jgi:crotonobetainyl-CoA:carnitine CoA-transferase CaiB-like acyl-CoA transferase